MLELNVLGHLRTGWDIYPEASVVNSLVPTVPCGLIWSSLDAELTQTVMQVQRTGRAELDQQLLRQGDPRELVQEVPEVQLFLQRSSCYPRGPAVHPEVRLS